MKTESVAFQALLAYSYVVLWVTLSGAVILYNKWLLAYGGFPFPISLTMFHMAFCSVLAFLLVQFGAVTPLDSMTWDLYARTILPIGSLYALVLWTGNSAYLYISVSFIQMLKALAPVSVFAVSCLFGVDNFTLPKLANMFFVGLGVVIASAGEIEFVAVGVVFQLCSMVMESCRLTLVQILLQRRGLKLNPVTTLYYVAPCCCFFLVPLFLFLELPVMRSGEVEWQFDWFYMITNAFVAFALNIAIFLLIGKTSALTMNVAGVLKDWGLILLSVALYGSPVMPSQYFGYSIAFLAVAYYNYSKYQAAMADKAGPTPSKIPETERLITPSRSSPRRVAEQSKDESV
mmetsp:Transcript_23992/g.66668  ORF Transcript_23992/g.66668 Transcript_23992/m.66668 type:complete len:346 (+) Transcript_23992:185-1222(+)|eukprot:CAMPEP_0117677764 /NCGR_PEP_ID=MMETSP0804-20121206/16917_1 /TAXON_ID=1074897 /ORGANISM="Tetraselmis astigmatica, Strain CCMP880" /LENGTH=345 /DNA_ID=CAMNT_0005487065 /DNA_START=109 /DNA_END=1146 /DNA_ORIENTATION=+